MAARGMSPLEREIDEVAQRKLAVAEALRVLHAEDLVTEDEHQSILVRMGDPWIADERRRLLAAERRALRVIDGGRAVGEGSTA
jgi:hypothetical protein